MAWLIVAALVLAVLTGLAGSAEVALLRTSADGGRDWPGGDAGMPRQVRSALGDAQRYLSMLALARAATAAGSAAAATGALVHWLGLNWRAFVVAAAVMTAVFFIVVGLWPTAVGRRYQRALVHATAMVLYPFARALGPLPGWLLVLGRLLTPGRRTTRMTGPDSEVELRGLVDLLEQRRVIEPGERRMIHSVFELGETIAREVMVPRTDMVVVERSKTLAQALSLALRSGFSRIPVSGENEDDIIGIAYLKDLVADSRDHPGEEAGKRVEQVMRPATFVPESKPVDDLLREMQARQIHLAIVIDEYGGTAGLVTIEDILEEIVGEITDEYDRELPAVAWLAPGRARVTARLPVTDLEELFGVRLDVEDVETVGGLLAHALGRVPIAGSVATVNGLTLTAESLAGRRNRISTVTVTGPGELGADDSHGQDRDGPADPAAGGFPGLHSGA